MSTTARRSGTVPRVVFDTNVVLSALVFAKGPSASLRAGWQGGLSVPLVSTATARELVRVLGYPKFRLDPDQQRELLGDYLFAMNGVDQAPTGDDVLAGWRQRDFRV